MRSENIKESGSIQIYFRKLLLLAGILFIITAWFSKGYNHFDEHFQIIEFAGLKLGLTSPDELPWEYSCKMRPAFQPAVFFGIYQLASALGIRDPFLISFILRFLSASLTFLSIYMMTRVYSPGFQSRKMLSGFLLLSFFLWFIPYNAARFSSDTTSGILLILGFTLYMLKDQPTFKTLLLTGIFFGLAFITKYQTGFMTLGFFLWLLFIKRSRFLHWIGFISGVVFAIILGICIDKWFYGEWVITSFNYLQQNILLDKASGFGTYPWWYYFEQVFMNAVPPFSLIYIFAVILYIRYFPKDPVTWLTVPFLIIHILIPHKEIRFLFPIIGFLPLMIMKPCDTFLQHRDLALLEKSWIKFPVKLFWITNLIMLGILAFRPADDQISLYQKVWDGYQNPVKFYYVTENPYHRAKVNANFYKRRNLTFIPIDSVEKILPCRDTTSLIALTRPGIPPTGQYTPLQVYSSLPPWVRKFNFNHWIERTSFWYIYELKPK